MIIFVEGQKVLIDSQDYHKIQKFNLKIGDDGYVVLYKDNKRFSLHRIIMNAKEELVDHINHNPLDNRRENLRLCSVRQNAQHKRKTTKKKTSIYKGVSWRADRDRWTVVIYVDGVRKRLGLFKDECEAALAYNRAAEQYFGQFACLNEIDNEKPVNK